MAAHRSLGEEEPARSGQLSWANGGPGALSWAGSVSTPLSVKGPGKDREQS